MKKPRVIVGNVDCESQCGEPERRTPVERWQSTVVAHRLLWLCRSEQDVCLFPARVRPEMIAYVGEVLQLPLGEANQFSPAPAGATLLLTEGVMAAVDMQDRLAEMRATAGEPEVVSYFVDAGLENFCRRHELRFPWPAATTLGPLNRKSFFRSLAESLDVPIPPGNVCRNANELEAAIAALLPPTGVVIVKQDLAGGGEGNVAVTTRPSAAPYVGTSSTYQLAAGSSLASVSREIFYKLTGDRNTALITEAYLDTEEVIYSEVWAGRTPEETLLLNWGGMQMEPKWIGFEIPPRKLFSDIAETFDRMSRMLAARVGALGFHGKMNCDAIVTSDGKLCFTEINVRLGGCTHVDVVARRLLGDDYAKTHAIKTRNGIRFAGTLGELLEVLGELKFDRDTRRGVLVLTEHLRELGEFECLCIGGSATEADALLAELLDRTRACAGLPS